MTEPRRDEARGLALVPDAALRLRHRDPAVTYEVDCRMLFMGDRLTQVERAYREITRCFAASNDPAEVRRLLAACTQITRFYDVGFTDGSASVTLRDEVFREPAPVDELELTVEIGNGRARVMRSLSPSRLCALGGLLPLLNGSKSADGVRGELQTELPPGDAAWALDLFADLAANGLVVPDSERARRFEPSTLPCATLLGHSSLLVKSDRGAVLVDPVLRLELGSRPEAFDVMRLRLDAIVCSHGHWDHCDLQTLLWLDKRTPVLIPRHRQPTAFNPPIRSALSRLGFSDIREVDHWVPVRIGDFEVVPVPFRGEQDEPDAEIDHYTYVIRTEGLSLFGGVDSYQDTFGSMLPALERVRDEYHPSVAFLPISKMVYEYRTGGVNGFCRFVDSRLYGESFQYTGSAEDAARWVAALEPRWVCPYAIFAFPRWSMHPEIADFALALKRLGRADRLFPLRPLDTVSAEDLDGGARTRWRRGLRVVWSFVAAKLRRAHWRFDRWRPYRGLRRVFRTVVGWRRPGGLSA